VAARFGLIAPTGMLVCLSRWPDADGYSVGPRDMAALFFKSARRKSHRLRNEAHHPWPEICPTLP
jgi:hypothetical protein